MPDSTIPAWLNWAREIQAISQTGLAHSQNRYDIRNYRRLLEIAAEMTAQATGRESGAVLERFRIHTGYATVKVDVRAAVVREGRILLVREIADGRWAMPGGWADVGEIPSEMVAREVLEESGYEVVPEKLVGVYDANRGGVPRDFFHAYKLVFLCRLVGGEPRASEETSEVAFFSFDDLPPLSTNRTHERHLVEIRAHLEDPARPAAFD